MQTQPVDILRAFTRSTSRCSGPTQSNVLGLVYYFSRQGINNDICQAVKSPLRAISPPWASSFTQSNVLDPGIEKEEAHGGDIARSGDFTAWQISLLDLVLLFSVLLTAWRDME
jgi:hypothetical protein